MESATLRLDDDEVESFFNDVTTISMEMVLKGDEEYASDDDDDRPLYRVTFKDI